MIVLFSFYPSKKGESVESFFGRLIERAENCLLGDEENTSIRDTFKLNMQDHDFQRKFLKETVSPIKAPEVAIHLEMGAQNQQKINQNLNTNAQSVNDVNNLQGLNCNANYKTSRKDLARYPTVPQNYQYTSTCANSDQRWSHNHR